MLARELRPLEIADVVIEKAAIAPRLRRSAAVLAGRALQRNDQEFAARGQCQTFETLVVLAASVRVRRLRRLGTRTGIIGAELILALAFGQEGFGPPGAM